MEIPKEIVYAAGAVFTGLSGIVTALWLKYTAANKALLDLAEARRLDAERVGQTAGSVVAELRKVASELATASAELERYRARESAQDWTTPDRFDPNERYRR